MDLSQPYPTQRIRAARKQGLGQAEAPQRGDDNEECITGSTGSNQGIKTQPSPGQQLLNPQFLDRTCSLKATVILISNMETAKARWEVTAHRATLV